MKAALSLLVILTVPSLASAQTAFVDGNLVSACDDYDSGTRVCGSGSDRAAPSFAEAQELLPAPSVLIVRGGEYGDALNVVLSGTAENPFVVQAFASEEPVVTGVARLALMVTGQSHVVVDGLVFRTVPGFGRLEDSDHVVLRNNHFEEGTIGGTTGGLKVVRSSQCLFENNAFINATDNVVFQESDRNAIVNNRFSEAGHSLLSMRCSSENVVRGNRFMNEDQKAMELYDCEGVSDAPVRLDAAHRNLIEGNFFLGTRSSDQSHDYNAIQYAGQEGIIRRNFFSDNLGGGLGFQVYSDEALNNYDNRAYHNTFVGNRCFAISTSRGDRSSFRANQVRLNLFFDNADCTGGGEPTAIRNTDAVVLSDNLFSGDDPGFMNTAMRDLTLTEGSSAVDSAAYLTVTSGSGSGTSLQVSDASYFFDGFGVEGQLGDLIQLADTVQRARVVRIEGSTLTLDRDLNWEAGQGVSLAFEGSAPDVGAHELGLSAMTPDAGGMDAGVLDASLGQDGSVADSSAPDRGVAPDSAQRDSGSGTVEDSGCSVSSTSSSKPMVGLVALFAAWILCRRRRLN